MDNMVKEDQLLKRRFLDLANMQSGVRLYYLLTS